MTKLNDYMPQGEITSRPDRWYDFLPQRASDAVAAFPGVRSYVDAVPGVKSLREWLGPMANEFGRGIEKRRDEEVPLPGQRGYLDNASPFTRDAINTVGMLATFLGPGAKTANLPALARAQRLEAAGVPREQIWRDEGWFKGADKKWRFELDDSKSSWGLPKPDDMKPSHGIDTTLSNGIRHDDLMRSYPGMADVQLLYQRVADPPPGTPFGMYSPEGPKIAVRAVPHGLADPKSTAMHEVQHDIQFREGFARGGTPKNASARIYNDFVNEINSLLPGRGIVMDATAAARVEAIKEQLRRVPMGDNTEAYRRLAGEVESRTVQKRLPLTAEQRRERPPWLDYDVPENMQIIRP